MTLLVWLGVVSLGCGWLFVVPVFQRTDAWSASLAFAVGVVALAVACRRAPGGRRDAVRAAATVLAAVSVAHLWLDPLVHLVGSRVHRLDPLSPIVHATLRAFGYESRLSEGAVYVEASEHLLSFTTNWEKLGLLPATWIGLAGLAVVLLLRRARPVRSLALLAATITGYTWLRYVTLVVLFLDHPDPRNLVEDHEAAIVMFQAPLLQALSFAPLALVLAAFLPWTSKELAPRAWRGAFDRRGLAGVVALAAAAAAIVGFFQFQDPGVAKAGRILIDDRHSGEWESAASSLDTETYGRDSLYNYATCVAFLEQYHTVDVNVDAPFDDELLADVDVLVVKTPVMPFARTEIDAVERFVEGGGGLFLIGDHTDLLGITTHANELARRFGMTFRFDAANRLDDGHFHTFGVPPLFPHPATHEVGHFEFMTSCTIDAPLSAESVMIGGNTFSDPLDYSGPSFFGNVVADTEDDFGFHLLAAARRHGRGRVLLFGDATVFSSFGVLYPGRPEFLLGVFDYLGRRNASGRAWNHVFLALGSLLALLGVGALVGRGAVPWGTAITFALGLGVTAGGALTAWHIRAHHGPPPLVDEAVTVLFPEDWGDFHLPAALGHVHAPDADSYDTFFVWMQRLGCIPRVLPLDDGLGVADVVVLVNPTHVPDDDESEELERFVRDGGRLLVMDTIRNGASTANAILAPFELRVTTTVRAERNVYADPAWIAEHAPGARDGKLDFDVVVAPPLAGDLHVPSATLLGGTALFGTPDGRTLVSAVDFGRGRVIALVDSVSFSRVGMGAQTQDLEPGDPRRARFEVQYALVRDYLLAGSTRPPETGTR